MTRSHALVFALAASILATLFASCCCCKHGDPKSTPPSPQSPTGVPETPRRYHDDGSPWPTSSGGSTNSTAYANGTFNYSTGLVLYDVSVGYATFNPTRIEVWAAPTGTTPLIAPGNQIFDGNTPPPAVYPPVPGPWVQGLSVPFVVGTSSYTIGIKVTFGAGLGYDLHRITFSGLYVPADG